MQPAAAATAAIMLSSFPSQNRFVTARTHSGQAHAAVDSLRSFKVINSLDLELRGSARHACAGDQSNVSGRDKNKAALHAKLPCA